MMLLNSTDTPLFRRLIERHPCHLGYFVSIRKRGVPRFISQSPALWAADNDCYNGNFEPSAFMEWLKTLVYFAERCIFVAAPDVVADGRATLKRFTHWRDSIRGIGLPVALVLQDGMRSHKIPWDELDAVFVGGSTEWKLSQIAINLLREAGERDIWRHVGRVNSLTRISHFYDFAESFDGTSFAIEPDGQLLRTLPYLRARKLQRRLPCFM